MLYLLFFIIGTEVNSKIDSVVICSDRVMVTRIADVYLDKTTDIVFADLAGAIDDASVRVRASNLRIGEVQVRRGYEKSPHSKVKELEAKIKTMEIEDRTLSDEILVLKDKEKFLQTIAVGGPNMISKELLTGKVAPESWRIGLRFMTDELISAKKRGAEIERQRVDLSEKLNGARRELNDIRALVENRKTVIFDVSPEEAKNYRIQLSYIVYGANWRTYYELRADPSSRKIDLSYFGKIYQRTNEDWDNTRIVLSTAKPALGGAAPEPAPWYIYLYLPRPAEESKLGYADLERPAVTTTASPAAEEAPAPPIEAGISIWYPLPGRYTINSGDPEKKIQIYETTINADFEYFIIPRITELAYSTGKMQNTSDYLLLAGEASTYVGDDFTGKTYLSTIAPDESTTVSFGIDERVKVKRELKKSKISKGGLFSNKTKYEYTYENTISNFHNKEVKCTIVDQIPIPQDPDIKVSSIKLEPKPDEEDKDLGIYYWRLALGAGKKFIITVNFTVEAPKDREIEGLMP